MVAALPEAARVSPISRWYAAGLGGGTTLGVLGVLSGTAALADGGPGTLSWGSLAAVAVVMAVSSALPAALEPFVVPRWVGWVAWLPAVILGAAILLVALLPAPR